MFCRTEGLLVFFLPLCAMRMHFSLTVFLLQSNDQIKSELAHVWGTSRGRRETERNTNQKLDLPAHRVAGPALYTGNQRDYYFCRGIT